MKALDEAAMLVTPVSFAAPTPTTPISASAPANKDIRVAIRIRIRTRSRPIDGTGPIRTILFVALIPR